MRRADNSLLGSKGDPRIQVGVELGAKAGWRGSQVREAQRAHWAGHPAGLGDLIRGVLVHVPAGKLLWEKVL